MNKTASLAAIPRSFGVYQSSDNINVLIWLIFHTVCTMEEIVIYNPSWAKAKKGQKGPRSKRRPAVSKAINTVLLSILEYFFSTEKKTRESAPVTYRHVCRVEVGQRVPGGRRHREGEPGRGCQQQVGRVVHRVRARVERRRGHGGLFWKKKQDLDVIPVDIQNITLIRTKLVC